MKRIIAIIIIFISCIAFAENDKDKSAPLVTDSSGSAEKVTDTTNPHYTGKYCSECHEKTPVSGGNKFLKYSGDFYQLCKCHGYTSSNYIHPVDIAPSEEKKAKIPSYLPLRDGKLSCITCHDIYMQCQLTPEFKLLNKRFLRGAPYKDRTALCFKCHDEKKYKKLDPHNQLDEKGKVIAEKCLYCHVEKPDENSATFKDVKLVGDLKTLCERCHGIRDKHPAGASHLRRPSLKALALMKKMESVFAITLPLDYDGKITCATCHNPHEKGVIPALRKGAKGASEKSRQRLPENMCRECHGMS